MSHCSFVHFFFLADAVLVKNHLSVLRHKLLENGVYDKHVKPDGKVNVKVGFSLIDLDLHPKTQVRIIRLFSIQCCRKINR